MMKAELQNMYILQEENKDLREELETYKSITHDERMKVLKEENESMKIRIGQLLERLYSLEERTNKIEVKSTQKELQKIQQPKLVDFTMDRPQTAQTKSSQPLISQVSDELDLDIEKLLERNRKQLDDLKSDMEEVRNMRPARKKI